MGQVIVRKLDDRVIAAHKRRAAARGVSLEQQLRNVLAETARPSREELIADIRRIRRMTPRKLTTDSAVSFARIETAGEAGGRRQHRHQMVDRRAGQRARRSPAGRHLLAPELIIPEVLSAAWRRRRLGEIADAQFDDNRRSHRGRRDSLPATAAAGTTGGGDRVRAGSSCLRLLHLALAEAEEAPLVTADRRLLAVVQGTALARRVSRLGRLTDRPSRPR